MSGNVNDRPARNAIVAILGTPDRTEGSLDDPREREEDGVRFNEKWMYTRLRRDPAGAAMRTVYWMRYDFRGTAVRNSEAEAWRPDSALVEAAAKRDGRLPPLDSSRNPALEPSTEYRPVSDLEDAGLGGGVQNKS
ncbi:MAG TPA: hypothetical protein VNF28_04330 [Candidatus Binataceae bacterium]|nr:hypothetical protein [Candidatus Binataceae bacterium]